jgi:hypothetical protein
MKFFTTLLLIALLSFASCIYFPWWTIALVAFIVTAVMNLVSWQSFLAAFIAVFVLWGVIAYTISAGNGHILAHRVAPLIIKTDSPFLLAVLSAFIGGIIAGLGALAGSFVRSRPVIS